MKFSHEFGLKKKLSIISVIIATSCFLIVSCATPPSKIKVNKNVSSQSTSNLNMLAAYNESVGSSTSESSSSSVESSSQTSSQSLLNLSPNNVATNLVASGVPIDSNSIKTSTILDVGHNGCLSAVDFTDPNFQYIDPVTNSKTNLSYGGYIGQWNNQSDIQTELAELKNIGCKYYYQNGFDILVLSQCATSDQATKYQQAFMALHN